MSEKSKETQFGGIRANPRHNGAWKKEDSARYKLEQMLKLNEKELVKIANNRDAPVFERRIAKSLLKENSWAKTASMLNQVYGLPKQTIEQMNVELRSILPKPTKQDAGSKSVLEKTVSNRFKTPPEAK